MSDMKVRAFEHKDVPRLLNLMEELARFEGYIDEFAITESDLIEHGLGHNPKFEAFVAVQDFDLCGMVVIYAIPWTFDKRPKLVLKELYVVENARGSGVGSALIRAVLNRAERLGASRISWSVLKGNAQAEAFYASLGGRPDPVWDGWVLGL